MNKTAISPLGMARLFGAAQRLAGNSARADRIDSEFSAAGESVAGFVMRREETPERSARDLVSAELVSPDHPCVVALSECATQSRSEPGKDTAQIAAGLMKSAADKGLAVQSAALKRRLSAQGLAPEQSAREFEKISTAAFQQGDMRTARTAANGFVESVSDGIKARDRVCNASRKPRQDAIEL